MILKSIFALSIAALSSLSWASCGSNKSHDSSCRGITGAYGSREYDNFATSSETQISNAKIMPKPMTTSSTPPNYCISMNLKTTISIASSSSQNYNPVSFISNAGAGYIGSASTTSPLESCENPAECSTWVPKDYPYLYTGQGFEDCQANSNQPIQNSYLCKTQGLAAYTYFATEGETKIESRKMIACKKNDTNVMIGRFQINNSSRCNKENCSISFVH